MKISQRGAINIVMVCAVVFGLGLGASVYLNYLQAQRAADDKAQLKGQISDLTYQLKQDRKVTASPSPSSTPSVTPSPTPSPSASPSVLASKTLALTELGVTVSASDPVSDLSYAYQPKNSIPIIGFTSESLQAKYPKCVPSFLGQISKRTATSKPGVNEKLIKSIGGNSYYYIKPVVECATDQAGRALRANMITAIQTNVLPSLN